MSSLRKNKNGVTSRAAMHAVASERLVLAEGASEFVPAHLGASG